jgi:hypothetical protein
METEPAEVEDATPGDEPVLAVEPVLGEEPVLKTEPPPGAFAGGWPATLGVPWRADGEPASLLAAISVAVVAGVVSAFVLPPGWALPIGGAVALAALASARFAGTRIFLTAGAVAAAVFAGAATVAGQMAHHYPPGDYWPQNFSGTSVAALVAYLANPTDSLVELIRRRASRNRS